MVKFKEQQQLKLMDCVMLAVTMFFIAYYFLRLVGFFIDAITFVIPLIVAVGYMMITINWTEKALTYIIGVIVLIIGVTGVELLCTNDFTFVAFVSMFTQLFMDMFPLYLTYNILKAKNRRLIVLILSIIFVVLAYVLVITIIELGKDDRFMRNMEINYTNYRKYNQTNAGGYQFAYAIAILIAGLFSLFLLHYQKYNKMKKLIVLSATVVCFYLVLNSSYTLALMISIITIFIAITFKIQKASTKVIVLFMGILGFLLLLGVSDFIISVLPTEEMRLRLSEVFTFFKSGDTSGYNLHGRLSLYWRAIKAFFRSPFVGNVKLEFDPHSSILRFFAKDGILGGVGYVLLYWLAYRIIVNEFIGVGKKKLFIPVFTALILMGMVNPIHSVGAVHYIVFLIVPLILNLIEIDKEKKYEASLGN